MEPSSAPSPTGEKPESNPNSPKRPLPKYTTIDLENELPELYSTSLNPNLHDPDLSLFYNQTGPPFYNYKRTSQLSPPPSYPNSITSCRSPPPSLSAKEKYQQRTERYKKMLIAFFILFVVIPFIILLLGNLLPAMAELQRREIE